MKNTAHFYLDGKPIDFIPGQTIMDAALAAGEYIPHLCHHPEFSASGNCRLCLVRVNGRYVSACTQPASAEVSVENRTGTLQDYRKNLLQMLFVEGNHQCPACEKSGACLLQAVAYHIGMLSPHYAHFYPRRTVDASHPDMLIDFNRCILCGLCMRASREADGKNVFLIGGRGLNAQLRINSPSGRLVDSDFSAQDRAAQVCPVGAILPKHRGYDVPIGQRRYDREPIPMIGDTVTHNLEEERK